MANMALAKRNWIKLKMLTNKMFMKIFMQNQNTKNNIKSFTLVALLLVGGVFVTAQGIYLDPTCNPPDCNTPGPIAQNEVNQEKSGGLVASGIINNLGDVVSFANVDVGHKYNSEYKKDIFWQKTPAYLFGPTYFQQLFTTANAENELCINPDGKVISCGTAQFAPIKDTYYTNNGVVDFPSGGVEGWVTYKIAPSRSCDTIATADTDWPNGTTLSGENSKKIVFNKWGSYDLKIDCDSVIYTATIKIGGKIIPTNIGSTLTYNLNLGATRQAYVSAVAGGSSGATDKTQTTCVDGYIGGSTSVKLQQGNAVQIVLNLNGGGKAIAGVGSGCNPTPGSGGSVVVNSLASSSTISSFSNGGYAGDGVKGGCSGIPDSENNFNTCNTSTVLPYGRGGSVVDDPNGKGGGGAAYASGFVDLPATGKLLLFVGQAGGKTFSGSPKGQDGYLSITW